MVERFSIVKHFPNQLSKTTDELAIEEPLEIILRRRRGQELHQKPLSVTMRTPGQDEDLAIGFMFTEGLIQHRRDLAEVPSFHLGENSIYINLTDHSELDLSKLNRNFLTNSSCGVCGKESIDAIHQKCDLPRSKRPLSVSKAIIFELPDKLRVVQQTFQSTGGIHAAAIFSSQGELIDYREDVGRHNALDKLLGAQLLSTQDDEFMLDDVILLLSGRASFELIQKAAMAGIQIVCAIGAPSSLAVKTAEHFDITLVGFLKVQSLNIYSGAERIKNA